MKYVMEVRLILSYHIKGGKVIHGGYKVRGSKNAALPILAASILAGGETCIRNCPDISDVSAMLDILKSLGASAYRTDNAVIVNTKTISENKIPCELGNKLRASVFFMAPLIARIGKAVIPKPGGCCIGKRPIDIHIAVMQSFGAEILQNEESVICEAPRMHGSEINLRFPSVGATENAIMAAVCAEGTSVINNCAAEPEIVCLADYLNKCGGRIEGAGTGRITVAGIRYLHGTDIELIPDRIECGTYMAMAAATGGELFAEGIDCGHIKAFTDAMELAGCSFKMYSDGVFMYPKSELKGGFEIKTQVYPGFPTDLQPIFTAMMCKAGGEFVIEENLFENRFRYIEELKKTGVDIEVFDKKAIIKSTGIIQGARMHAHDLRGGAALVTAALAANGESVVTDTGYIQRGYCGFDETIRSLGGDIWTI